MELFQRLCVVLVLCSLCTGPVLSLMFHGRCPIFFCHKTCFNGYKIDFRGCKMCLCRTGSQKSSTGTNSGMNTGNFAQANYRPVILIPIKCKMLSCTTTCSNGRQRDNKGCETCTCKTIIGGIGHLGVIGNTGHGGFHGGFGGGFHGGFNSGFNAFNMGFSRFLLNGGSGFLSVPCPINIHKAHCPLSPCLSAKCHMNPFATCVESYCGGCHAAFYFNKKRIFC